MLPFTRDNGNHRGDGEPEALSLVLNDYDLSRERFSYPSEIAPAGLIAPFFSPPPSLVFSLFFSLPVSPLYANAEAPRRGYAISMYSDRVSRRP